MIKLAVLIIIALTLMTIYSSAETGGKNGITLVPVFFYSPETRMSLGIYGLAYEREICDTPYCRPSSLRFVLTGTQNSQTVVSLNPEFITKDKKYIISALFGYINFPSKFFGIGDGAPAAAEENYTARTANFQFNVQRQVDTSSRVGVRYDYWDFSLADLQLNGLLAAKLIPGSVTGKLSGAGFTYEYDTRDNVFSASNGAYHDIYVGNTNKALGSDFNYMKYELNLRRYIPVFRGRAGRHVLALQAKLDFNSGTLPFQVMPAVGGSNLLRGYYEGRFRDKNFAGCQAEYRLPVNQRVSFSMFGAAGEVAGRIEDFRADGIKPAAGAGFRFTLNTREKIIIRTDYGVGVDSAGLYVNLFEAF